MRRLLLLVCALTPLTVLSVTGGVAVSADHAHVASSVPLIVVKSRSGAVAAVAKVAIHGRVFPFLIDTGATTTVVNFALVHQLRLRQIGKPVKVQGVGCTSSAGRVRLSNWRIGRQPLPTAVVISARIAANGRAVGLLGSDLLSRFGSVGIDYRHGVLRLG